MVALSFYVSTVRCSMPKSPNITCELKVAPADDVQMSNIWMMVIQPSSMIGSCNKRLERLGKLVISLDEKVVERL